MSVKNEENILYGGPEPPLIDDESKSLGEVLLKKLTINPDEVMFVSNQNYVKKKSTNYKCRFWCQQNMHFHQNDSALFFPSFKILD